MAKKDTKLKNLSKTVHMFVEEIRVSGLEELDHIFMNSYFRKYLCKIFSQKRDLTLL